MPKQAEMHVVERHVSCNTCGWETGHVVWSDSNYRMVACGHCHLVSLDPLPDSLEEKGAYDEREYHDRYETSAESRSGYFRERVAALKKRGASGRLLDVGAGPGFFIAEAIRAGFAVEGVEASPFAVAYAQQILGVPVEQADFTEVRVKYESFDVLTFWDSLGHIRDPHKAIEKAARMLVPGGMMIVETPQVSRSLIWLAKRLRVEHALPDQLSLPEALHHYSEHSLKVILEDHGLDVFAQEKTVGIAPKVGTELREPLDSKGGVREWIFGVALSIRRLIRHKDRVVLYARRPKLN